jgi:hypothetical protein
MKIKTIIKLIPMKMTRPSRKSLPCLSADEHKTKKDIGPVRLTVSRKRDQAEEIWRRTNLGAEIGTAKNASGNQDRDQGADAPKKNEARAAGGGLGAEKKGETLATTAG